MLRRFIMKALNMVFIFLIIVSFIAYFYYKTKQFRNPLPIAKKWYKSKAGVALGLFVIFFGLNQAFLFPDTFTYIIVAIFIFMGIALSVENYKRARHYGQFVEEEFEINKTE